MTDVWDFVSCVGYTVVTLQWVVSGESFVSIQFGVVYCSSILCEVQGGLMPAGDSTRAGCVLGYLVFEFDSGAWLGRIQDPGV